jgi:Protein of unknown function (DUF2742)
MSRDGPHGRKRPGDAASDRVFPEVNRPAKPPHSAAKPIPSQQVSWWDVHEFVAPFLAEVGDWPMIGSPAWVALPDGHPAKLAAVYDAAQHWALRVETGQAALAEASRAVAGAVDWAAIAIELYRRDTSNRIRRVVA